MRPAVTDRAIMTVQEQLKDTAADLVKVFDFGGRFKREKLFVVGGYALLALLTVLWALSGGGLLSNPIGARVEAKVIGESTDHWLLLQNESSETWTHVELTLNDHYSQRLEEPVPAHQSVRVMVDSFRYRLYVPRARRFVGWQSVGEEPQPRPFAPASLEPKRMTIRTDQGEHALSF